MSSNSVSVDRDLTSSSDAGDFSFFKNVTFLLINVFNVDSIGVAADSPLGSWQRGGTQSTKSAAGIKKEHLCCTLPS